MEALVQATTQLDANVNNFAELLAASQVTRENSFVRNKDLSEVNQIALEFASKKDPIGDDHEKLLQLAKAISWDDGEVENILNKVKDINRLRARRAGLQMRLQRDAEHATNETRLNNETESDEEKKIMAQVENLQSQVDAEKRENEKVIPELDREIEIVRQRIALKTRQMASLKSHLEDLETVCVKNTEAELPSNKSDPDMASVRERISAAEKKINEFQAQAQEWEEKKRMACSNDESLVAKSQELKAQQKNLSSLQDKVRQAKNLLEELKTSCNRVLEEASTEKLRMSRSDQGFGFAAALLILIANGGEMLVKDWKDCISCKLDLSSAKTTQIVYGLVASTLVKIDRTQSEARALSLVCT